MPTPAASTPGRRGTAGDELLVTQAAMAIPTFAAVVAQPTVTLPIIGVLTNYVSSVGTRRASWG